MPRLGSRVRVSFSALSDVLKMTYAQVAELVDAHVSGACVERHAGSSPVLGTKVRIVQSFNQESERWRNW